MPQHYFETQRPPLIILEVIMPNQPYIPADEANRSIWLSHFAAKLPLHAPTLGIDKNEIDAILSGIAFFDWIVHTWNPTVQKNALEATAYKNMIASGTAQQIQPLPGHVVFDQQPAVCMPGILNRLANLVQRIKLSPGYNESIGQDLGIVGTQNIITHPVPEFSLVYDRSDGKDRVKIAFTKYEHEGISINGRRNNGEWEHLGIATTKPWHDDRPLLTAGLSEMREYRLCWWDKNYANGDYSPIQIITVGP